jgi:predicted O-methyltransferase YrrM
VRALSIDGYTKESELWWLRRTARAMPDQATVVEVGSWHGRSTVAIAEGLVGKDARLIAVDTFAGDPGWTEQPEPVPAEARNVFDRNLAPFAFVEVIQSESINAAALVPNGSVDWVFIDALHDYASVRADIAAWSPKLRPGGLLSGHDYGRAGVTDAVRVSLPRVTVEHSIWATRETPRLRPFVMARIAVRRLLRPG